MNSKNSPQVAIIMGSTSDQEEMKNCMKILTEEGINHTVDYISAHREPEKLSAFLKTLEPEGYKVIIAAAGGAAALPGVCAAYTDLPVIGVPLTSSALNGIDSLYSIVMMPGGVPVATMSVGSWGAKNAAVFAAKILKLID
ncbi:MAG: 5-(carboxyamino)imidazole ribonucleotide mutase [Dehalococcoidia bacterium]|nr:5-(carboxyamino)imidazole ribonucleotide mutase [Dehalococcoidia bacterium]